MRVLLTGASGFVGRNLIRRAPADWEIVAVHREPGFADSVRGNSQVTPVRCDLGDPAAVRDLFARHGHAWDCCLYLAAKVDIPWSVREPREDLLINTGGLLNVLGRLEAERLIYFSSGAVYDGHRGEAHPDTPLNPTLPYAISKLASERYVEFCRRRKGSLGRFLNVRFFGAYGPYEASHKIYTRLLRTFVTEGKREYTLYGDGQNLIDAMYVDDAVDAVQRMVAGAYWDATVNLAAGTPMTIEALVHEVAGALGAAPVRIEKTGVAHEKNEFWGSTREMRDHFGFVPSVSLADGIRRFRDFLVAQDEARVHTSG